MSNHSDKTVNYLIKICKTSNSFKIQVQVQTFLYYFNDVSNFDI